MTAPDAGDVRPPGFTIITGMSGAGRSETAHSLEDLGFFVVDNMPPALLGKMAELAARPGGPAKIAIVVEVKGVFMHCAKAFRRSRLWDPEHFQDRAEMPSLIKIILDETTDAPLAEKEMRKRDDDLEKDYQATLY